MSKVKIGDTMNLSYEGLFDFGSREDSRVVEIKKNGTIVLACGMKFHANGDGHAANSAVKIRRLPIFAWNDSRPEFKPSAAEFNRLIEENQKWLKTATQEQKDAMWVERRATTAADWNNA